MIKPEICELYRLCAEITFSVCNEIFMPLFCQICWRLSDTISLHHVPGIERKRTVAQESLS